MIRLLSVSPDIEATRCAVNSHPTARDTTDRFHAERQLGGQRVDDIDSAGRARAMLAGIAQKPRHDDTREAHDREQCSRCRETRPGDGGAYSMLLDWFLDRGDRRLLQHG